MVGLFPPLSRSTACACFGTPNASFVSCMLVVCFCRVSDINKWLASAMHRLLFQFYVDGIRRFHSRTAGMSAMVLKAAMNQ